MIGKASPNTAYTLRLRLALRDIAPTVATSYMLGTLDGKPEQKGVLCKPYIWGRPFRDLSEFPPIGICVITAGVAPGIKRLLEIPAM